ASGRMIAIRFAVIPATGTAARDPVVPIPGGPGSGTIEQAGGFADELRELRETRDILLVDLRGTGGSNLLECEMYGPALADYLGAFYPAERVRRCAERWRDRADVSQYNNDASADDLDEVRAALGYERLNLYGTSAGTRTALVYMRRHPDRVRSAVLHGVVPTDAAMPLHTAPDAQRAMDGVLADCAREPACNAAFPALADDLRVVVARLARGPVEVTVSDPVSGEPVRMPLSRDLFAEGVRYMTYGGSTAALIPAVLHQAARGDLGPAAEEALFGRRQIVDSGSHGVYLSFTCAEDVPFVDAAEAVRLAEGTFLGGYRVRDQKAACAAWPVRPVPRAFLEPVRSDAPVLVLTGEWDPATPPSAGEEALRTLPNGRHVVVPSGAHSFDGLVGVGGCITPLIVRFIRTAAAKGLDDSCVRAIHRPPFPTRLLPVAPIAVDPAELARLAGTYRAESGFQVEAHVDGGRLRLRVPQRDFVLIPVGPGQFRLLGFPFVYARFGRTGDAVTSLELIEGGGAGDDADAAITILRGSRGGILARRACCCRNRPELT
ncbi:MAG TPA: alpha/beta hydrolase, partial [Longimicrobiaceae bacterium]|nr:alpha/beta hydrolase [Longimicrobiaceae bacterium]